MSSYYKSAPNGQWILHNICSLYCNKRKTPIIVSNNFCIMPKKPINHRSKQTKSFSWLFFLIQNHLPVVSRSSTCRTERYRSYTPPLTISLKLAFIPPRSEGHVFPVSTLRSNGDACGGDLAGENLFHMLPETVNGWLGSACPLPCLCAISSPDSCLQTKAVFYSQGAAVPGRKQIGNDTVPRPVERPPSELVRRLNSASKGGTEKTEETPPHT